MKLHIIVLLIIALIGCANTFVPQSSASEPQPQFSVDSYEQISHGMTREETIKRLGGPEAIRSGSLSGEPFHGPQEGINIRKLDNQKRYEEWLYEHEGVIYLIWFGDPVREESDWRTIGKMSYPKGAVF